MRFNTQDIDLAVARLDGDGPGGRSDTISIPETITLAETISIAEAIGFEATLKQRPYIRPRTVPGALGLPPRLPADRDGRSNGVPLLIRHEDDDVCCDLWCAA
ncbi:MAG TPA: hypothetical protein VLB44_09950 [Kofleriaceae bacterium]|nr:hypothetical protein [Kofleriaceae bacterium]